MNLENLLFYIDKSNIHKLYTLLTISSDQRCKKILIGLIKGEDFFDCLKNHLDNFCKTILNSRKIEILVECGIYLKDKSSFYNNILFSCVYPIFVLLITVIQFTIMFKVLSMEISFFMPIFTFFLSISFTFYTIIFFFKKWKYFFSVKVLFLFTENQISIFQMIDILKLPLLLNITTLEDCSFIITKKKLKSSHEIKEELSLSYKVFQNWKNQITSINNKVLIFIASLNIIFFLYSITNQFLSNNDMLMLNML